MCVCVCVCVCVCAHLLHDVGNSIDEDIRTLYSTSDQLSQTMATCCTGKITNASIILL